MMIIIMYLYKSLVCTIRKELPVYHFTKLQSSITSSTTSNNSNSGIWYDIHITVNDICLYSIFSNGIHTTVQMHMLA